MNSVAVLVLLLLIHSNTLDDDAAWCNGAHAILGNLYVPLIGYKLANRICLRLPINISILFSCNAISQPIRRPTF